MEKVYLAIDLKSFYASVECAERGLNPLNTNLVVADTARTEKTICLAVSPALKSYGISGRARLFEVIERIGEINSLRRLKAKDKKLSGESVFEDELISNPSLALSYIAAPPRMALYMEYSLRILKIYLKYIAPEDIHIYSIDEVFIDITHYLAPKRLTANQFAVMLIKEVFKETGITATAGIGSNLYLCKVALDIVSKHIPPDENGVRIGELDEQSYRQKLWSHRPITDFWRVGKGYEKRLSSAGLYTMGDIARCSVDNEELLYKMFGVNAELLIDHAWGYEPCTISDIKSYKPEEKSVGSGQVLSCGYSADTARLIVKEMADSLALDLADKGLVTDRIVLHIGYERLNANSRYTGEITEDYYGRKVPKSAHGTENTGVRTCSAEKIINTTVALYDKIINPELLIKRIFITALKVEPFSDFKDAFKSEQLDLFTDYELLLKKRKAEEKRQNKEMCRQKAIIGIKKRFGKNAVIKGMSLTEGATAIERNNQIGGHKA